MDNTALFVLNAMKIEEFIYKKGLASSLEKEDVDFMKKCTADFSGEADRLFQSICRFEALIEKKLLDAERARTEYIGWAKTLADKVKNYNELSHGEGIWSSAANDKERRLKLGYYYDHLVGIDSLVDKLSIFEDFDISELQYELQCLMKKKYISELFEEFACESSELVEKCRASLEKSQDSFKKLVRIYYGLKSIADNNSSVLGQYLIELERAIDAVGKGEKMDLRAVGNANIAFLSSFSCDAFCDEKLKIDLC